MSEDKRAVLKEKRVHQVKRQKKIIKIAAVVVWIAICIYIVSSCGKKEDKEVIEVHNNVQRNEVSEQQNRQDNEIEVEETLEEQLERVRNEAMEAEYPEGVIELLSKNPETVTFVENYNVKKDTVPVTEISELIEGEIPHLLQWDERWGYAPYGTSIVAVSGCGPTCLSMVISGLTGDKSLTPARMAEYGTEHHYINEENDTYWIFMSEAGKEWGIQVTEKTLEGDELKRELLAGHPVICSVGPGHFTQIGHFIVLAGYEEGKIIVHDPFSIRNTEKRWEYDEFKDQIKSMWTYSMN